MRILRRDEETIVLEEIEGVVAGFLRELPASADPAGSAAATARLFPQPTGGREPTAEAEWREYVEPDLRALFRGAVEVVETDLAQLPGANFAGSQELHLPMPHLEAWMHTLNQARLVLAARHEFTDEELEREIQLEGGARALVLLQVHFYGLLLEFLLRQLD